MERVFFHYSDLEEVEGGLWRIVRGEQRKRNVVDAAELMRDVDSFAECMNEALEAWPNSSKFNLCNDANNRIAWLGHAGCCLGVGSPEENTRCAWHTLSHEEQDAANAAAQAVLTKWESENVLQNDYPLLWIMENA